MGMNKIDKERTWVFSPVNNIVMKADIKGNIAEEQLQNVIKNVALSYEMLCQKIVLDEMGNAYYKKAENYEIVVKPMDKDWRETASEQEKIPFKIENGELIRFFYQLTQGGMILLIIAHHLAGDGISYLYFLQDFFRALEGENIKYKKLNLFDKSTLPKESKLKFPTTWLLKSLNGKWRKSGKVFNRSDYYTMYDKYWHSRETLIESFYIENEDYDTIINFSKANNVSVNSLITTALIRAAEELSDVGMAVSVRKEGNTGMGNYASGISIKYQYNQNKAFLDNAIIVQKLIYNKLNKPAYKYFLLQFMGQIEPTLMDAVYFAACGEYENKTANIFSKMFGYNGNPKGISITNLTKLPAFQNNNYELTDFIFVPPLVLNAKRIIGVASFGRKMVISLHINCDEQTEMNRKFFLKGMEYLKGI